MKYPYKNISIERLGHDWFLIHYKDKEICIDPFKIKENFEADYIFITHNHKDHLSLDDIKKVIKPSTIIIAPNICKEELKEFTQEKIFVSQDESKNMKNFNIRTLPAYNTNKFRSPGIVFHAKEVWFVWYVFDFDWTRVYHAGDTDIIPEMKWLSPDIALLPVSGTYVMTAEEAVKSLDLIQPKIVIPMHYDSIVGTKTDAECLKTQTKYEVVIL